jgi:hypothetical protein
MPDSTREVQLSQELCQAAEQKYGERFGGLEHFLNFVLQEIVRDDPAQMDQAEQSAIEARLKDLGYI